MLEELINIFEKANEMLIIKDNELFITKVSERTLLWSVNVTFA